MNNREFADKIYTLRSEKGFSQKELGNMLGVSDKAVSKWETGDSMPKTATLVKIAELFDIDINELMGSESRTERNDSELTNLKAENALLKSQIVKSDKKKKLSAVVAVILCIAVIAAAGVFAFFSGRTDGDNSNIKDLGKDGTSIAFAGRTFEPFAPLDSTAYSPDRFWFDDTKEAKYTDLSGATSTVMICCDSYYDYIEVEQHGKEYYYIADDSHIKIDETVIANIFICYGDSVATNRDIYGYDNSVGAKEGFKECFVEFYETKKETSDKRAAELFLGNNGFSVAINLNEDYDYQEFKIGEFFTDSKGKVYFYDYTDTKTYDVGKEMAKYVKGD